MKSGGHVFADGQRAGLAEVGEGFEDVFDAINFRAFESFRERSGGGGGGERGECGTDGLRLLGEGFRPSPK